MSKADNVLKNRLLMKDAEEARDSITKNQQREIKKLYSDWAKEVGERAEYFKNKTTPSSVLAEQQLRILQKQLVETSRQVSNELNGKIKNNMYLMADSVVKSNEKWLKSLGFTNLDKISAAFINVPDQQVRRLITGQVYQSGWSLSKAIWSDNEKALKDIYSIVASGLAQNRPIYEIAKNLESYVNPNRKLNWNLMMEDGRRIYKKSVDYNAQRLARTLVQHSYQSSFVAVTKNNPLITSYRWIANGSRVCPLCMELDGRIFEKDNLPLDHPNGMCTMEPVIDDNYLDRLANWAASPEGFDPELDEFAKNFGYVPEIKVNEQKINNAHYVAQGKDITNTWVRRHEQFAFEIEDVINAQGFDGKPKVVSAKEFDKAVKESNIIMQRGYRAPDKEILSAYRNELYYGNWYVDCSVGGAGYGKGMYTAYNTGTEISEHTLDMAKSYANLGYNMVGNIETMTFDPSFKVIDYDDAAKLTKQFRENFKIGGEKRERVKNEMVNSMLSKYDLNDNERNYYRIRYVNDAPNPDDLMRISEWYMGLTQDDRARIDKFAIDNDFFNEGLKIKSSLDNLANIDEGTVAVLYGYDGIVGDPLSYGEGELVVLNRTKIIIKEP